MSVCGLWLKVFDFDFYDHMENLQPAEQRLDFTVYQCTDDNAATAAAADGATGDGSGGGGGIFNAVAFWFELHLVRRCKLDPSLKSTRFQFLIV